MHPLLFILLAIVALILVSGYCVFIIGCRGRGSIQWLDEKQARKSPWGKYYQVILDSDRWLKMHMAEDLYITSYDGLRLHGLWISAPNARGTVLMAHGYRSTMLIDCHLGFELFHRLGFNILVPEQRTHGQSQGRFITFGVKESHDMQKWIAYHNAHIGNIPLVLFGISMGASTMLYLADRLLPDNVKGIIADCGFTSPAEILSSVYTNVIHLPATPSVVAAGLFTKLFAGFSLWERDTRKILPNSRLPILLIHGDEDSFVPCKMSRQAYAACKSPKQLLIVEGAEHGLSFPTDGYRYTAAVIDFIKQYVISIDKENMQ